LSDHVRIVEVEPSFYVTLLGLLETGERWYDNENKGTVLYSFNFQTGETTKLVFKRKVQT
jgi:hypothetical protein